MALTEIEYGSLASSDVMNNNFEYLDNKITDVSENLASNVATINANIATANTSISTLGENVNKLVENLNTTLTATFTETTNNLIGENGLFITFYQNDSSWYREYFSEKEKTTRVWIEQGGVLTGGGDYNRTVVFPKAFSNTNYVILKNSGGSGPGGVAERWMGFWSKTTSQATTGYINHSECWYACGI